MPGSYYYQNTYINSGLRSYFALAALQHEAMNVVNHIALGVGFAK